MALFVGPLWLGWSAVTLEGRSVSPASPVDGHSAAAAILVRCGTVPAHCWVTDWSEHASPGIALLFVVPLSGVYAAVRLVLPIGLGWVLQSDRPTVAGLLRSTPPVWRPSWPRNSAILRPSLPQPLVSVLVGLELHTELSLTASLCPVVFRLSCHWAVFGLTSRALGGRQAVGSRSPIITVCTKHTPALLAVCFPAHWTGKRWVSRHSRFHLDRVTCLRVKQASSKVGIITTSSRGWSQTGSRCCGPISISCSPKCGTSSTVSWNRLARAGKVLSLSALILGGGLFPTTGVCHAPASRGRDPPGPPETSTTGKPRPTRRQGVNAGRTLDD